MRDCKEPVSTPLWSAYPDVIPTKVAPTSNARRVGFRKLSPTLAVGRFYPAKIA